MTDKDVLYEAINKAEKNGYSDHIAYLPIFTIQMNDVTEMTKNILWMHKKDIVFSCSFAKAFFGEQDIIYCSGAWARRLEEMSHEENEIKYLKRFL